MKLHELKQKKKDGKGEKKVTVDLWNYGSTNLVVKFDYEAASSTRHGDDSSFDEDYPEEYNITSIELDQDVNDFDEYGEETDKIFKKGSDATKLPGWDDSKDTDAILDILYNKD